MKVEMQEKELLELQSKLEELQKMADEARHLKDEVDILRETADKAVKYEATIASYKKKLEEYGDLKRQVKILEDKNTDYMQQNMELEEVCVFTVFVIITVVKFVQCSWQPVNFVHFRTVALFIMVSVFFFTFLLGIVLHNCSINKTCTSQS
jgi:hypothetical protein